MSSRALRIDEKRWAELEKFMTARIYRGKHIKACECIVCVRKKIKDYQHRAADVISIGGVPTAKKCIPVRQHFRGKPKGYLKNDPVLKKCIEQVVKQVLKARGL